MKKFKYLLILVMSVGIAVSCTDDSLDPLKFKSIQKGTELALRGTQLQNLYVNGVPGAEIFPKILTGNEVFNYDAEYLASDKSSLASMDIYVYKVPFTKDAVTGKYSATGAAVRTPVMNVPFSQFKADATYLGPWVSVSITLPQMLTLLGLPPASDASYKTSGSTNPLLTIYKLGINMDTDLNLVSGSKILAADIVAAGLFQSNQFYPAMKLTWTVTDYCPFIAGSWTGSWIGTEVFASSSGDDDIQLFQDATNPNKYVISNFWGLAGCGGPTLTAFIIFSPSTNPSTQTLTMPSQSDGQSTAGTISGTAGKYNQCTQTFSVQVTYVQNVNFTSCQTPAGTYKWRYDFHRP